MGVHQDKPDTGDLWSCPGYIPDLGILTLLTAFPTSPLIGSPDLLEAWNLSLCYLQVFLNAGTQVNSLDFFGDILVGSDKFLELRNSLSGTSLGPSVLSLS